MNVSLRSKVCEIIHAHPGVTQLEISRLIYGSIPDQGQVTRICRDLIREGHIDRAGKGGPHDPYTYTWIRRRHGRDVHPRLDQQQLSM